MHECVGGTAMSERNKELRGYGRTQHNPQGLSLFSAHQISSWHTSILFCNHYRNVFDWLWKVSTVGTPAQIPTISPLLIAVMSNQAETDFSSQAYLDQTTNDGAGLVACRPRYWESVQCGCTLVCFHEMQRDPADSQCCHPPSVSYTPLPPICDAVLGTFGWWAPTHDGSGLPKPPISGRLRITVYSRRALMIYSQVLGFDTASI